MLEKLAKQTAVYGISTIAVRFLSYLLTPYYTRIFGQETRAWRTLRMAGEGCQLQNVDSASCITATFCI